MFTHLPGAQNYIPPEYKKTAKALFPAGKGKAPSMKDVENYALSLGIADAYKKTMNSTGDWPVIISGFRENFSLLIAKTWVDDADEIKKQTLQARLPEFFAKIEQKQYTGALEDFSVILEELAFLFFGKQSVMEDFTDYVFHMDLQMGLFWWYGSMLSCLSKDVDDKVLRAVLILGLCYLTNF